MRDLQKLEIDKFLSQAEMLAQLTQLPAWEAWTALFRDMRQAALEELGRADPDSFRYWQGVASALGEILDRPGRITVEADAMLRAEQADGVGVRPELRAVMGAGFDPNGEV